MFYSNYGNLNVQTKFVHQIINKLVEKKVISSVDAADVYKIDADISAVDIGGCTPCYGDIEMNLSNAIAELKESGIIVSGQINYDGDYSGVYYIKNGAFFQYSSEEWSIREALAQQKVIGNPLADEIYDKVKSIQKIPGVPVTVFIVLEEIVELVKDGKID